MRGMLIWGTAPGKYVPRKPEFFKEELPGFDEEKKSVREFCPWCQLWFDCYQSQREVCYKPECLQKREAEQRSARNQKKAPTLLKSVQENLVEVVDGKYIQKDGSWFVAEKGGYTHYKLCNRDCGKALVRKKNGIWESCKCWMDL